jgi:hypothetical protein
MLKRSYPFGRFHTFGNSPHRDRDHDSSHSLLRVRDVSMTRHRPTLEWLEPRMMLSGNSSPIASLQPYDGEQLTQSPQELVITFNGLNVPALMGSFDVQIEELNRDGTKTPLWNFGDAPPELSDATGTELIIPLQKFNDGDFSYDNVTLPAGQYEIDLVGGTSISYAASGAFGPGPVLWNPNQDHPIGTFTILGQGATISPSDSVLTTGQTTWGWLDPSNPSSAVDLYKFTLPAGNLWQVGLAISANSIGSTLLTNLSLFGADGTLLATRNSGTGIPSNPNDPYLFAGLEPGTYYVGVSGADDVPYTPGGYDPVLGIPGLNSIEQSGGLFALNLTESPHIQATRLLTSTLDYSPSDQSSPTGITLTFSGPIDLSNLFIPDVQESALEVLDASGQAWPVTAESYEVSDASLELIFDRPLPPGGYTLVSPAVGGLADLAEQRVLGTGGSSSVLATWTVALAKQPPEPNDLGILWPLSSSQTGSTETGAFYEATELAPGQAVAYSFTIIVPGFHQLQTQIVAGDVAVEMTDEGVTTVLDGGTSSSLNNYVMQLNDGVYSLRFSNAGPQTAIFNWQFKIATLDWEKVLNNGISQTSALSVGLFSPSSVSSGGNVAGNSAGSSDTATGLFTSASVSDSAGAMGPIPSTLMITLNTGLIGPPTVPSQSLPAVGPMVEGGSAALASSGNSFDLGVGYASALDWSEWLETEEPPANLDQVVERAVAAGPVLVAGLPAGLAHPGGSQADSAAADERALGQAEWLFRLGARLQGWLGTAMKVGNGRHDASVPSQAREFVQNASGSRPDIANAAQENRRGTSTAGVDLGATACAILVGAAAYKLRRPVLQWWRRHERMLHAPGERSTRSLHRGPHAAVTRSHARTRSHKPKAIRLETREE